MTQRQTERAPRPETASYQRPTTRRIRRQVRSRQDAWLVWVWWAVGVLGAGFLWLVLIQPEFSARSRRQQELATELEADDRALAQHYPPPKRGLDSVAASTPVPKTELPKVATATVRAHSVFTTGAMVEITHPVRDAMPPAESMEPAASTEQPKAVAQNSVPRALIAAAPVAGRVPWPRRTEPTAALRDLWELPAFDLNNAEPLESLPGWKKPSGPAHNLTEVPHAVRLGWLEIPNTLNWWPKQEPPKMLRVDVAVPVDAAGKPLPGAADLVAVIPWQQLPSGVMTDFAVHLVRRAGFTVFCPRFGGPQEGQADNRQHFYRFPESGSDQVWLAAAAAVRKVLKVPEKKLFVWGQSVGGSAAAFFADAKPAHVEALAYEGVSFFADKPKFQGPTLSLQPQMEGDGPNEEQEWQKRRGGGSLVRARYRPAFILRGSSNDLFTAHVSPPDVRPVPVHWFAAIADRRWNGQGGPGSEKAWPLLGGQRLPHATVGQAIASMIAPPVEVPVRIAGARVLLVEPVGSPRAVILLADGDLAGNEQALTWDLQMLAERGYRAIGSQGGMDSACEIIAGLPRDTLGDLPVISVRIGDAGDPAVLYKALGKIRGEIAIPVRGQHSPACPLPETIPRLALVAAGTTARLPPGGWTIEELQPYDNFAKRRATWMRTIAVAVDDLLGPVPAAKPLPQPKLAL